MDAEQIKIEMTRVIADVIENHPGPNFDMVAADAAAAVLAKFDVAVPESQKSLRTRLYEAATSEMQAESVIYCPDDELHKYEWLLKR